ncbi:phage tail spike protein [uncultured Solobacterium sp.]|uniref:phage tail spike protein n=1 Tax=uncultured Solobacterium sp. TaxID=747375 RepID=UPI002603930F|nr:phage tail spike protein [uncultured Solobacterium sp.]
MKPILYESSEKQFTTNGIGTLADAISCTVIEERNGSYELEMEYPLGGINYDEIRNNRIILAMPSDGQKVQPFRVFKITRPIGGVVKIYAVHLSYDLSGIPVAPFTANDCSSALNGLKSNSMIANPFEVWTDISGSGKYKQNSPASFRSRLAGTDGSILDSFGKGAELEFDRLTVKVHQNRGRDNGVTIRYGKNLTDLKQQESIENVRTGVIAYWYKEENNTQDVIVGEIQYLENHADYPKENIHVLDCSADFEKKPDKQQLNTRAKQYIKANNIGVPKVSIDVSFIQLWQTEEYKNIVSLERVSLCDTVHVVFDKLGVNAVAKVIKTEFDVLNERYIKITLGEARSSFGEAIREATKSTIQPLVKSMVNIAVSNATANISGFSGYVTKVTDANGNWSELVISDNADYTQARNVWRWSQGGLGFSSNGYAGPYTTAITADGHINGAMITAGTINANTVNVGNKVLTETLTELADRHTAADGRMRELASRIEQNTDNIVLSVTRQEYEGYKSFMRAMLDENGLHVGGEGEETQTSINGRGVKVVDTNGKVLAQFDKLNNILAYLAVREFLSVGSHRLEAKLDEIEITEFANGNIKTGQVDCTYMYWIGDVD